MSELKVIRRNEYTAETSQTPGMERKAGIARETARAESFWMGFTTMAPGAKSGVHHHGACESGVYVLSGRGRMLWGERLEHEAEIGPGDFIYVPPNAVHQEINDSASEPLEMIVARNAAEGLVVNLEGTQA